MGSNNQEVLKVTAWNIGKKDLDEDGKGTIAVKE